MSKYLYVLLALAGLMGSMDTMDRRWDDGSELDTFIGDIVIVQAANPSVGIDLDVSGDRGAVCEERSSKAIHTSTKNHRTVDSRSDGNKPPMASIVLPVEGLMVKAGQSIMFQGTGADTVDGALSGVSLSWSSDLEGEVGRGECIQTSFTAVGLHTVRFIAVDSNGLSAEEKITVHVVKNNGSAKDSNSMMTSISLVDSFSLRRYGQRFFDLSRTVPANSFGAYFPEPMETIVSPRRSGHTSVVHFKNISAPLTV